jgi:hypothetical protein
MVNVISNDGQQIKQSALDFLEPRREGVLR